MPRRRERPTSGQVEREFMEALQRLVDGQPADPDLAKKARSGTLKINVSTVAEEAGRSRTLVSHDGCAYPRVRAAVLSYAKPPAKVTSKVEINRRLRKENAELRRSIKLARETTVAVIRRMERVKHEADREVLAAQRRAQRGNRDPNEIAGVRPKTASPATLSLVRASG